MDWKQLLVYISGSVEEELLLRIEYLIAENRILRDQVKGRLQLSVLNVEPWLRLAKNSANRRWKRWLRLSNRTRFWPGIASW